jgi:hypothetical protein
MSVRLLVRYFYFLRPGMNKKMYNASHLSNLKCLTLKQVVVYINLYKKRVRLNPNILLMSNGYFLVYSFYFLY